MSILAGELREARYARPAYNAWFHCYAGIAGDMALGSLLDAGADFDEVVGAACGGSRSAVGPSPCEPVLRAGHRCDPSGRLGQMTTSS